MENRISADFHREMIKLQSQITDSHNDIKLNAKLSKMEETANHHAEETERVREVLQSQTAIGNKVKLIDDNQRRHADRMKKEMERWKNNILVETTKLQTRTVDSCNQKIREMEEKATHLKQQTDEIQTETKARLQNILDDIERKLVISDNSRRQDFQTKLDELLGEMRKHVNEMKTTMSQVSGMNSSKDEAIQMNKQEDSVVPEYNILLLGESGSGKSTFINSLANYVDHEQLNDALSGGPARCLIPTTIIVTDDNYREKQITIAMNDDREVELRQSNPACRTYILDRKDWRMQLIYTSGYLPNNGSRHNVDILKFIGRCKYGINVIAIVVKSNQSELPPHLSDLFQSLLGHTSVRVLFLLTHSEDTDYRPGDVIRPLKQLLAMENLSSGAGLSKDNTYCFDNKGYLYLLGKQSGHSYGDQFEDSCHIAWNSSALECKRLLQSLTANRITSFISTQLADNLLTNIEAKQCYQHCSDYIKKISDSNNKKQADLNLSLKHKSYLSEKLNNLLQHVETYFEVKKTRVSPSEYVCLSKECFQEITTRDGTVKYHFPQKCPIPSTSNAFYRNCIQCNCSNTVHHHLDFTTNVEEHRVDPETNPDVTKIRYKIRNIDQHMGRTEKEMNEYATIESICNAFRQIMSQSEERHDLGQTFWEENAFKPDGKGRLHSDDKLFKLKKQLFDLKLNGRNIEEYFKKMEAVD